MRVWLFVEDLIEEIEMWVNPYNSNNNSRGDLSIFVIKSYWTDSGV